MIFSFRRTGRICGSCRQFRKRKIDTASYVRRRGSANGGESLDTGRRHLHAEHGKTGIFRRRQIGLIYQFFNLIPTLNVEENITLPCELDGQTVDKKRLDKLIDELGLNGRKTHLPEELSGGQQQRVSIGRALINRPAIVLADEPTGNLDKKNSDEIVELLRRANQEYRQTIIMITHNLEIAKTADRVIVIEDGKIIREG